MFHVFVRSTLMKTVGQKGIKKGIKNIKTDNWMLFFAYFYHVFLLWWKL